MQKTQPKLRFPKGETPNPTELAAGRYGTKEMCDIWGAEKTFGYSLKVQGLSARVLSELHPDVVPREQAEEIYEAANLNTVDADRIRELEEKTGHDVIAINTALEEQVSGAAGIHINKAKTSADTTQPAKALQLKDSLEVIVDSVENLRDIVLEKSLEWIDKPHMDTSHLYDALPTVAGRTFTHYAELLQSGLKVLKFVYENSVMGKWGDATGNHHSATALGIDGIRLQQEFCERLGVGYMDAPAQIPGLEFEADITFAMARIGETINNLAEYIANGRSDDVNIFVNASPRRKKGSSAMPHKDTKNGNPTAEEQAMSHRNYMNGNLTTAMMNCRMPYARILAASSNQRINFEDGFKFFDHTIRRTANVVYWLGLNEERSKERVERSYGCVTSQQVMTYLTDQRKTDNPMTRSEAHDLMGKLATTAYENKTPFVEVLLENKEVTSRLSEEVIKEITAPLKYIGESKTIVQTVFDKHHGKKTLT
jgi:adenylosuccinate lyase